MQITRDNYAQYAAMVQQLSGSKRKADDPYKQCDYGNVSLRFQPVDLPFTKPDWSQIMTKRDKPAMSEEEFTQAIKDLAEKEFRTGKRDDKAYRELCMRHGETVSPDRKAIYNASMKRTGGKMNAACMFWDANGNKSLSYNPESRNWKAISTEAEFARAREFTSIYNQELARLKQEYGQTARGTQNAIACTISEKGLEQYRQSLQTEGSAAKTADSAAKKGFDHKASLKQALPALQYDNSLSTKVSWTKDDSISDIAQKYLRAYSDLYDEITQGYADGTREVYVLDESSADGYRRQTLEEELQSLEKEFQHASQLVEGLAQNSTNAAHAFEQYAKTLATIPKAAERAAAAQTFVASHKETIPQDIGAKMNQLALQWKESYAKTTSKTDSWNQLLPMLNQMLYPA